MNSFEYTSVHQYLDCVLHNNPNATHAQIREAKKAYWKLYYSYYRKQKRKNRKEFTLGFYKEQLEKINLKRGKLTISKFLYKAIYKELMSDTKSVFSEDEISTTHLHLMQLISTVEELLEDSESKELAFVLEKMEEFEEFFSRIFNL